MCSPGYRYGGYSFRTAFVDYISAFATDMARTRGELDFACVLRDRNGSRSACVAAGRAESGWTRTATWASLLLDGQTDGWMDYDNRRDRFVPLGELRVWTMLNGRKKRFSRDG